AVTKLAGDLYSVGRVQTPTLALLVQREQEIAQFSKQSYFQVRATFAAQAGTYIGLWLGPQAAAAGGAALAANGKATDAATMGEGTEAKQSAGDTDNVQPGRL